MSGTQPETPEEIEMRAGEYVLGVLDPAEMQALDRQARSDQRLAQAIAGWERRLAPMLSVVNDMPAPAAMWAGIQQAKAQLPQPAQAPQQPPAPSGFRRPGSAGRAWPWKLSTGASLALAAGLAAFIVLPQQVPPPPAPPAPLVAVLAEAATPDETRPETAAQTVSDVGAGRLIESRSSAPDAPAAAHSAGFLVAAWPDGSLVLSPFAPVALPQGKVLELWIKPADQAASRSLGVLTAAGLQARLPSMPAGGAALTVTLEPLGGAPGGVPGGRVVYAGTLRPLPR